MKQRIDYIALAAYHISYECNGHVDGFIAAKNGLGFGCRFYYIDPIKITQMKLRITKR